MSPVLIGITVIATVISSGFIFDHVCPHKCWTGNNLFRLYRYVFLFLALPSPRTIGLVCSLELKNAYEEPSVVILVWGTEPERKSSAVSGMGNERNAKSYFYPEGPLGNVLKVPHEFRHGGDDGLVLLYKVLNLFYGGIITVP